MMTRAIAMLRAERGDKMPSKRYWRVVDSLTGTEYGVYSGVDDKDAIRAAWEVHGSSLPSVRAIEQDQPEMPGRDAEPRFDEEDVEEICRLLDAKRIGEGHEGVEGVMLEIPPWSISWLAKTLRFREQVLEETAR